MIRKNKNGSCHLCGKQGKLSFEHVPPRSCFNSSPIRYKGFYEMINEDYSKEQPSFSGKQNQKGSGGYTLCMSCNNNTGSWYGNGYVEWTYQGMENLKSSKDKSLFSIYPLQVIKQIICMMFSTNHQGFYKKHPELQKFVLNKKDKYLDPKYRIYAYYNGSNISRSSGIFAKINLDNEKDVGIFSEFSFPPWGYAFTPNDSSADNDKFMDISFFAGYDYDELVEFELPILKLPVESYFPMDFRTRGEIVEQSKKSD